jgi:3-hydroxyisobutyrate dehydrogenase
MFNDIHRVGFAGLGAMGGGIAQRLLDAGYEVVGWNRTREKATPLMDAGMGWAERRASWRGRSTCFSRC